MENLNPYYSKTRHTKYFLNPITRKTQRPHSTFKDIYKDQKHQNQLINN